MAKDAIIQTMIRLPSKLHKALKKAAVQSGASLNSEMVERLEWSINRPSAERQIHNALVSSLEQETARLALNRYAVEASMGLQIRKST